MLRFLGLAALALLFVFELGCSLSEWRQVNHGGARLVAVHSFIFLAFLWVTVFFAAERTSSLLAALRKKGFRIAFLAASALAAFLAVVVYNLILVSMTLRFVLGCYLNPLLLRFAFVNMSHGLWGHMARNERWALACLVLLLLGGTVWVCRAVFRAAANLTVLGQPRFRRRFLVVWLALSVCFTLSTVALNRGNDHSLRARMANHLSLNLDPVLTFFLGCLDLCQQSRYENVLLEERELTPIRTTDTSERVELKTKPNVLFFMIESFRADLVNEVCQGREVIPNINRLAREGTWFTKAYSPGSHTSLANPAIPSSLYTLRKDLLVAYSAKDPYPKRLIYDELKPYGYATAWISSDIESWCGMDEFLQTPALDLLIDATSRKLQEIQLHPEQQKAAHIRVYTVPDRITIDTAKEWLTARINEKKPFFAMISLKDSHFPYKSSIKEANWFQPAGIPENYSFCNYPKAIKEEAHNTYRNAIRGIDMLVGEVLDLLRREGVEDNTIVVVVSDHAEAFYENNLPSHANLPYESAIHSGLIMWGRKYFEARAEDYPASLIDATPTVLARLGLSPHPNFQGVDLLSTNRPPLASRCLYVHVDGRVNADAVQVAGRWKYFEDNSKGHRYLFDLARDPGEAENLLESQPEIGDLLAAQLDRWRTAQLTYYRSARYYSRFYPPPPPMLTGQGAAKTP